MKDTRAQRPAGHLSRRRRTALAPIAVAVAWLCLAVLPVRAQPPMEDAHATLPSVLLLPPRLPPAAGDAARAEADAACDHLAGDLAAAGLARVVDRTQVDRILQEQSLQAGPARPMLSYDAMIRLEADTSRLAPETTLSLIDLSTGNVTAQQTFPWPPKEDDAKAMRDFCRDGLKRITKPGAGTLRVRTLWATEAIASERIRPLGKRLIEVFDEALRRSNRLALVHHLEAASAKEESLLLLMGLSRLPGGRQFTPQADATIELRVVEGDGSGKTFPETPVEIGVRLRKGAGYEGDWVTTAGPVRDFDALIPQAWRKLAQSLGEVHAETATTLLDEMSLRRKQADAELQTAQELRKSPATSPRETAKLLMAALPHAEAALKLDPTYPEAVRVYVDTLAYLSDYDYEKRLLPEAPFRLLREAAGYLDRFHQDAVLCGSLCESASRGVLRSPLMTFWRPQRYDDPLPPFRSGMLALTPELVQALDAAKRVLERGFEDDVKFRFDTSEWMLVPTVRGMRLMNVPAAQRQAWLTATADRCLAKVKRGRARAIDPIDDWQHCIHLQARIAELLIEEGQTEAARRILDRAQSDVPPQYASSAYGAINLMRAVVGKANDARLRADFDQWIHRGEKAKVRLFQIDWPALDIFAGQTDGGCLPYGSDRSPVKIPIISDYRHANYRPLAEGDGRLYFYAMSDPWIACVPVDARGWPIGEAVRNARGWKVWDHIEEIPQPQWGKSSWLRSAHYIDGKLYVSTHGSGLQVFDPKTKTWKGYGPEQGLPSRDVDEVFPIGGQAIYCNSNRTHFILSLADGAVTLVHRADLRTWEKDWSVDWNLLLAWRDGRRVVAVDNGGVWDDLLSASRIRTPLPAAPCYGWPPSNDSRMGILNVLESGGRRLCVCAGGLYELDAAGKAKLLRAWQTTNYWLKPAGCNVIAPADCPFLGIPDVLGPAGSYLAFTDHFNLAVYDLSSDMWYGPLHVDVGSGRPGPIVTSRGVLWGAAFPLGLTCLALDDAVAYAKSIGRAMSTTEYRRRQQRFIATAKPLDRAKFNLGMRRFDQAKAALQEVLDTDPDQPEALLLMGFLHLRECLDQPDEALKYYRRAAALEDNPVASYSGMYFWARILHDRRQWAETLDLCQQISRRYPGLEPWDRQLVDQLRDSARQQLAAKTAKQPAPAASNKREEPAR